MSRLPTPGSDDNTWGDILNDYLAVVHNTDGTLKTGVVTSANILDATITTTDISATAGIVKGQLASAVQTSLGLADTALQTVTPATSTVTGGIRLTGDLAGNATSPALATTGVTAGNYGTSMSIPTLTIDSKGRITAAGSQSPAILQSYFTTNTGSTDVSKWTKIATQTIVTLYTGTYAVILLQAMGDAQPTGSYARVALRIKQQDAFGNNPIVEFTLLDSSGIIVPSNLLAIVTQNTPSVVVDFYVQITEQFRYYGLTIQSAYNDGNATTQFYTSQGFTATGSLPTGTKQQAGKYAPTNPASPTLVGGVQLAGDFGGTAVSPLVAKLNGVTLSTTAPTTGQALLATSATAAAWGTVTDTTRVAKSGDTMTGNLTVPNLNAIKTPAPADIYQWFYTDPLSYNQVPFGEIWHDLLAFNKLWTVTSETTNDGNSWSSATVNKKVFAHLENQSIQILNGTTMGVRWTFSNAAYSTPRWLMIAYAYVASSPNVIITVESSNDGSTWTARQNATYTAGILPVWHSVLDNGGDQYLRIRIQSTTTVNISSIRLYSNRWGDQGAGKEIEQPYTWNELGYIGIGKGLAAPSYPLDVTGDANITGQIHNVTNPTSAQDVATKAYVDANVGGGGGSAVTLSTTQTITGAKTFANDVKISGTSGSTAVLFSEDQTSAPQGVLLNAATYVANSYTLLTPATTNQNGELEYTVPSANYGGTIDATFDIYAGGGTGANGIWFYAGSGVSPTTENAATGYAIYFSENSGSIFVNFNGTSLTSVSYANLGNATWRTARFTLSNAGAIAIYINGTSVLTYADSVRTLSGTKWGFGARTGGSTNEHRVRNISVLTTNPSAGTPVGITIGSTVIKNGKISNVTDPTAAQDVATKAYVDANAGSTPDATTTTKGKIQLAGDLGGTAAAPFIMGGTQVQYNYVVNPSFESSYTGWTNYGSYGTIARDNTTSQVGSYSSKHTNSTTQDGGITSDPITLSAGTYNFSVYAKLTSGVTNASVVIRKVGETTPIWNIAQTYSTANWTQYGTDFTLSATTNVEILLGQGSYGYTSSGTVWYDAISIQSGSGSNTYFDGNTATAGTTTYGWTGTANNSQSTKGGRVRLQTTDQLTEGTINKYFTTARAWTSPTLTGTVTVPTPVNATDAATKNYVDSNTVTQSQLNSYAVDSANIGIPFVGANGITVTETSSAITIGYSGSGGSGGAIGRIVSQVTAATTAAATASTDYVYWWSGATAYTLTMPTAASNTNRYTLKNSGTVSQPVNTTSSQTIEGGTSITISAGNSVDLISNGSNWMVI